MLHVRMNVYVWEGEGECVWAHDEWVMARRSTSHFTYINLSYYSTWMCMRERGGWVGLSARWMSHVTDQWVMSHIWMCHIIHVHEGVCVRGEGEWVWALDEWVMSRRSMSHVTHMNVSCCRRTWACMCERGGRVGLSTRWMSHGTHQLVMSHI